MNWGLLFCFLRRMLGLIFLCWVCCPRRAQYFIFSTNHKQQPQLQKPFIVHLLINNFIYIIKDLSVSVLLLSSVLSNLVYWDKPPPLFQDLAPPLALVITHKYRTYTYHTWYGVRAVIVLYGPNYKPYFVLFITLCNKQSHSL